MSEYKGQYNWIRPSWFEEGYEKGYQQGLAIAVLNLLNRRIGKVSKFVEKQISQLSTEKLEEFGDSLFDFKNEKDVELWLKKFAK